MRLRPRRASISSKKSTIGSGQAEAHALRKLFRRLPGGASGTGGGRSSGGRRWASPWMTESTIFSAASTSSPKASAASQVR